MVREIVHIQVGQCGNQIGNVFWSTLCNEHNLDNRGHFEGNPNNVEDALKMDKLNVYFRETSAHKHVPRAVLVDLEPGTMDAIKASPCGNMFRPDNFVFGANGAGNIFAVGHYTEGAEMFEEVMDVIRQESEACDCVQGFQVTHSLGGGTGSGLGTLALLKIRDSYPDRINASFSVYPSPRVSDTVVEPYNAILSIHQLLENTDETFVIDNEALYNIAHNLLKNDKPRYRDLNWIISLVMSGVTSSLRFPGQLNGDLRKMGVNLVPFPRLHFFAVSQAPLFSTDHQRFVNLNVRELTRQMWAPSNLLANLRMEDGKFMAANLMFRGNIASQEVDSEINRVQNEKHEEFVEWIPNNIKTSMISVPPNEIPMSGTFVGNTTAISTVFSRISSQFGKLYKRKGFLHWYTAEGMDRTEFEEAAMNIRDLIVEYQDKQNAIVELDPSPEAELESDSEEIAYLDDESDNEEEPEDEDEDEQEDDNEESF